MSNRISHRVFWTSAVLVTALLGCADPSKPGAPVSAKTEAADEVAQERSKLSPEDRALVDAQEWCVVQEDERLGSMGPPIKVTIKGEAVFVCCKGCKKKAEENPERTLAKLKELQGKKRQQTGRS